MPADPLRPLHRGSVTHLAATVADGSTVRFLHDRGRQPARVQLPAPVTDPLSGDVVAAGEALDLDPWGVLVLQGRAGGEAVPAGDHHQPATDERNRTMTSRTRARLRRSAATALLLGVFPLLAACGQGAGGKADADGGTAATAKIVSQAEIDKAMSTPTKLLFWSWTPDIGKQVALFEKAYPNIDVELVVAGQGDAQYTALRTALTAGKGVPDVAQIEYQFIPTFTVTKSLLDLRPYGAEKVKDLYVDWTWSQVSGPNGEVWAYPQDTGPMGMLYRQDIFAKAGIKPPTTWEEFAEAARTLKKAQPDVFLTNIAPNSPGAYTGLLWQSGAEPFTAVKDGKIGIALKDDASKRVAEYWQGLIKEGVVSTDPDFTDQWYQGLNRGRYATWLTAAWGPAFLAGQAADTKGLWRAAPLPNWKGEAAVSGNWGGSTSAVMATTKNPIAAAKFAEFINTDPKASLTLATEQFTFPATKGVLENPEWLARKSDFYGGQQVNQVFADISKTVDTTFVWSPFQDQVFADWNDTVGTTFTEKGDAVAATEAWDKRVRDFAKVQGFTTSN